MTQKDFSSTCTDHAHAGPCDPRFGVIVLVNKQLSVGVSYDQLVQLQRRETAVLVEQLNNQVTQVIKFFFLLFLIKTNSKLRS